MSHADPPRRFTSLAFSDSQALVFGRAPRPVRCGFDLVIGAGQVLPEVNFTLPPMSIALSTDQTSTDH